MATRHVRAEPAAAGRAGVAGRAGADSPAVMPVVADTAAPVEADMAADRVDARPRRSAGPVGVCEMCGVSRCFPTGGPVPPAAVVALDASAAAVDVAVAREAVEARVGESGTRVGLLLPAGRLLVVAPETAGGDREDPDAMPPG